MTKRLLAVSVVAVLSGCIKEVTSDERLERETVHSDASKSKTAGELSRLRCDDIMGDLLKARDANRTEEDRLSAYTELYEQLRGRSAKFDDAMARNPDLAYQEGSQDLVAARDGCVQQTADVKVELESLIREIMQVLIVNDVRGGQTVRVARIDFSPLKNAIEKLELDDRDALLQKIGNAEKEVDVKTEGRKRNR